MVANLRGPDRKSVGKPDAGNRHIRLDERRRETGTGTAPFLDSTQPPRPDGQARAQGARAPAPAAKRHGVGNFPTQTGVERIET
jgi:hypothetical protein